VLEKNLSHARSNPVNSHLINFSLKALESLSSDILVSMCSDTNLGWGAPHRFTKVGSCVAINICLRFSE